MWSLHKYLKRANHLFSLTVMKEHQSIGVCQMCSECKGTVLQGRHCVRDVDIRLVWSSQKLEKMCLISSHEVAKFCATPLANVQSWKSTGRTVCRASVDEVWEQRGRRPGKSVKLLETSPHCSRKLLIFLYLLKVRNAENTFYFLWIISKKVSMAKVQLIFFCTCLKKSNSRL